MDEPLKKGDLCIVLAGFTRAKSPNVGLIVTVDHIDLGEPHRQWGQMVFCRGEGIMQMDDTGAFIKTNCAHFAKDWLKKIDPKKLVKELKEVQSLNKETEDID